MDLDELERLARAATPGPWRYEPHGMTWAGDTWLQAEGLDGNAEANALYFAAIAPEVVLYLIECVRASQLREQLV